LPSTQSQTQSFVRRPPLISFLLVGAWFGLITGLAEGPCLLLFQRINWARWGPTMHVSEEILWISPLVDVIFFLILALLVWLAARIANHSSPLRVVVFALTFFVLYDWLTLTARLYHGACVLLALGIAVAFSRWVGKREPAALRFWKRTIPWVATAFLLILVGIQGGKWLEERRAVAKLPPMSPGSPNVLILVVDTLRADHLSSYGYARPTSIEIDLIAEQGVRFENAIAPCSWSLPSHVSLLTGRYLFEHGVGTVQPEPWLGWDKSSLGGFPTLGEELQKKGYRTGAFSANRTYFSRDLGFGRGFIHFEDYFHSPADMFVRTLYGREFARIYLKRSEKSLIKRALRAVGFTSLLDQDAEGSGSYGGAFGIRKRANVINEEVLRWIDSDRSRPFFAFLNYFDVHDPYGSPPSYPRPTWEQATSLGKYDAGVQYVDDHIKLLMEGLEQRSRADNTLIVITSDHGESLGQHNLETHGRALYWELIHVPLVIWYPGHVPAGQRLNAPVPIGAIPATIMELLGAKGQMFGAPALNAMGTAPQMKTGWRAALSELAQNKYGGAHDQAADHLIPTATKGPMESLVTEQWHLIVHRKLGDQLYDWRVDPGEANNLTSTAEGRVVGASLKAQLENILNGPSATAHPPPK
jgi:arylsulfatase A-like enzyme